MVHVRFILLYTVYVQDSVGQVNAIARHSYNTFYKVQIRLSGLYEDPNLTAA